jgi:phage shock protein C
MKKLTRSREHRLVSGVLGGLGQYLNLDPVAVRFLFIVLLVATGLFPGVLLYILAVFMIPEETVITPSRPVEEGDHDTAAL